MYKFEVLYLRISILCNFIHLLHYISGGNIDTFTKLHVCMEGNEVLYEFT